MREKSYLYHLNSPSFVLAAPEAAIRFAFLQETMSLPSPPFPFGQGFPVPRATSLRRTHGMLHHPMPWPRSAYAFPGGPAWPACFGAGVAENKQDSRSGTSVSPIVDTWTVRGAPPPGTPSPGGAATQGWVFQEPKFRCGLLLTSNKPPSPYLQRLQRRWLLVSFPILLRKNIV